MKDTVKVRPLRPYEKIKLRRLKKLRRNTVNSRNARIILIATNHPPNRVIAEQVGCSAQWVRHILHRFNDDGVNGITWYPWFQMHSPRTFPTEVREQIAEIALSSPISLIGMKQWSVPKLRQYLIEQVIHGDADRILPIGASGLRTANQVKGARLVVVKNGPHCITWTHADEVTPALVEFLN